MTKIFQSKHRLLQGKELHTICYQKKHFKENWGVPVVAQCQGIWLAFMRMQVWSLGLLSGLKICCCEHRRAATAQIRPLAWESPYAMGSALKRQKKKHTAKKKQNKKKQNGHLGVRNQIQSCLSPFPAKFIPQLNFLFHKPSTTFYIHIISLIIIIPYFLFHLEAATYKTKSLFSLKKIKVQS